MILALETSCDDTCAAVVDGARIRSNVISSQAAAHARYGGVVPEVASRHHLELVNPVVDAALAEAGVGFDDLDALAVTRGPGLIGALLVGVATAKSLAAATRKPLVGVDHLHGHVAANFLDPEPLDPPFVCLIASGGHTQLAGVREPGAFDVLGQTLDDAAGEALDKGARLLGLGYPGGPAIERLATEGDPEAFDFPVAMAREPGLDFSFSGLKTALLYAVRDLDRGEPERRRAAARAHHGPVRGARSASEARPRRALHGQRGDDRLRGAVRGAHPVPRLSGMGCPRVSMITLYTRPGCHLCDEVLEGIVALRGEAPPFQLREVNIDDDDELHARYLERIPVVEVDGEIVSELHLNRDRLLASLDTVRNMTGEEHLKR